MKEIKCVVCNCTIDPKAGYYNFTSGVQCSKCGEGLSKKLDKALKEDPFGLNVAVKLNRLRNNPKKR